MYTIESIRAGENPAGSLTIQRDDVRNSGGCCALAGISQDFSHRGTEPQRGEESVGFWLCAVAFRLIFCLLFFCQILRNDDGVDRKMGDRKM